MLIRRPIGVCVCRPTSISIMLISSGRYVINVCIFMNNLKAARGVSFNDSRESLNKTSAKVIGSCLLGRPESVTIDSVVLFDLTVAMCERGVVCLIPPIGLI